MADKKCLVFSGPSGSGKSTLIKYVLQTFESVVGTTVSCTTRQRRHSETDGIDYHFIANDEFDALVERGEFLEYTECYGNRYGTLKSAVHDVLRDKDLCVIDMDFNGACRILTENAVNEYACQGVLVLPPSLKTLENRLRLRKTETSESIKRRIDESFNAPRIARYEYVIVNNHLESALAEVREIVENLMPNLRSLEATAVSRKASV
ncbi:MAG: guanylate kinase [Holosporales bacterium]|jgi:guanylate kinase|nr:guanylate kinase [Holosporales bacterium]